MEPLELARGSCCSSGPGLSLEMSPGGCEESEAWLGPGGSPRPCPHGAPSEGAAPEPREPPTEDDIYCRCLSRTLCHTATPVTVGFYAPCGHRLESLLAKVTAFMREEMAQHEAAELRRGQRKPRSPHGWGLLEALWLHPIHPP